MLRLIALLFGIVLSSAVLWAGFKPREATPPGAHQMHALHPKEISFAHDGVFGTYDRAQLQRGYQVYKEVCSACHGLTRVAFRNLTELGFSAAEVKALAAQTEVPSIDEATGDANTRKALPADHIPSPFANVQAAKAANNGKAPPDLSLMVKSRHGGERYVYSLLTGYQKAPPGEEVSEGTYYNPYFSALKIGMPPPLTSDGQVEYADGTKASVSQMSEDVSAFLAWAAEPRLEDRKRMGVGVIGFLVILSALAYGSYRKIRASVMGH